MNSFIRSIYSIFIFIILINCTSSFSFFFSKKDKVAPEGKDSKKRCYVNKSSFSKRGPLKRLLEFYRSKKTKKKLKREYFETLLKEIGHTDEEIKDLKKINQKLMKIEKDKEGIASEKVADMMDEYSSICKKMGREILKRSRSCETTIDMIYANILALGKEIKFIPSRCVGELITAKSISKQENEEEARKIREDYLKIISPLYSKKSKKSKISETETKVNNYLNSFTKAITSFRLPVDSNNIDRYIKSFSKVFSENTRKNESILSDKEFVYPLSYASLLVSTDLHNKKVKRKMTKDQFLNNIIGITLPYYNEKFEKKVDEKDPDFQNFIEKEKVKEISDFIYDHAKKNPLKLKDKF